MGTNRVSFFHQTFLEFAIALFFEETPTGEEAKRQELNYLTQPKNTYSKYFIWPVIRLLLNLIELDEFQRIANQLPTEELSPFRAVAFASVSRTEPESSQQLLHQLLPLALQLGDAYQDILLVAASGAPTRHAKTVWLMVLELLSQTKQTLVNKAAEVAGELLSRIPTSSQNPIDDALAAVTKRILPSDSNGKDSRTNVFGQLISSYVSTPKRWEHGIDDNVLRPLQQRYFSFGSHTRSQIIQLYLTSGVPLQLQQEFLMSAIAQPITDLAKEKDKAVELLENLLPSLISSGNSPFGSSYIDALHAPLKKGWDVVQAGAVGHHAAKNADLMAILINELFKENVSAEDQQKFRRHQVAIAEAVKSGAAGVVGSVLLKIQTENVPRNRLSTISVIVREIATHIHQSHQAAPELCLSIARWVLPLAKIYPTELTPVLDVLTSAEPQVEPLLSEVLQFAISQLSQQQINLIIKKLNNIPSLLEPYLLANSNQKEFKAALVKVYQRQVLQSQSEIAVQSLLSLCLDDSREVGLDASKAILNVADKLHQINIEDFIRILAIARILGIRNNCLKALVKIVESTGMVADTEILNICTTLKNETASEILQPLFKLIECWVQKNNRITDALVEVTLEIANGLVKQAQNKPIDGGVASSVFITLKNIANLEYSNLSTALGLCTRNLLRHIDVMVVNTLFVIGLLDKIARFDSEFLAQIVREDFVIDAKPLPTANLCAVAIAIVHSQGKQSLLLDEILQDERLPPEVKSRVIRERER